MALTYPEWPLKHMPMDFAHHFILYWWTSPLQGTLLRSLGCWVKTLLECLGNTSSGNRYSWKIKIELFHHPIAWWLIELEHEKWNSLTFLWTNKWWLCKDCSESVKPSELVLLIPRHRACTLEPLWDAIPVGGSSAFCPSQELTQVWECKKEWGFLPYVSGLLCRALLGTVVSQPVSSAIY